MGFSNNAIICNKVDFPDPDGPLRDINSPSLIDKFISSLYIYEKNENENENEKSFKY